MPKPMSKSQLRRAERDQKRREAGELPVQAEKRATTIVSEPEMVIDFENTAEVYAWAKELGKKSGIIVKPDVRLHK
jgi:hypothetical protein